MHLQLLVTAASDASTAPPPDPFPAMPPRIVVPITAWDHD
jgi:hypothetical protein